jgi:hypothetical protein
MKKKRGREISVRGEMERERKRGRGRAELVIHSFSIFTNSEITL